MRQASSGPIIAYGQRDPNTPNNPDLGPSMFWGGGGLLDHRAGYNKTRRGAVGFPSNTYIPVLDAVPATQTATNIAASAVPVAGTAFTLVAATGAGVTVLAAATQVWASGAIVPAAALALDGAPGLLNFGRADGASMYPVNLYDPTKALSRNVRITSVGNDSSATFLVSGYDLYGYAMSELITGANAGVATGIKCFKFITSVLPAGTLSGSAITIGTGDVFGLPLRVDSFYGDMAIFYNGAAVTATTGFTAAVTTAATTTSGDVRGKYAVQSASDASKRLQVFITPKPSNISTTGLFGVTQA